MKMIEILESRIKDIKTRINENEKILLRKKKVLNNIYKYNRQVDEDVIKTLSSQICTYSSANEVLNIKLCRYTHLVEYIKKHNRVKVAYAVYGENGHRQRASWNESSKVIKDNITVEFLNSDITGCHDYTVVIITASNHEECENELYAQLSDGVFENCNYGEIVELDCCDDFNRNVEIMATIGVDEFIR